MNALLALSFSSLITALLLSALVMLFSSTAFGSQQSATDDVNKQRATELRIVPGQALIEGVSNIPTGPLGLLTYRLEEVTLPETIKIQRSVKQYSVDIAIRLTIAGKSVSTARVNRWQGRGDEHEKLVQPSTLLITRQVV